jgi:alpha-beta hydrolase superfamily lysophospholipase
MTRKLILTIKILASAVVLVLLTLFAVRIYDSQRGLPLEPWHTFVPQEMSVAKLDAADWTQYLAHEAAIFEELRREVTQKLPEHDRVPFNRYFEGSPIYPGRFKQDFNRSFVLAPEGKPVGAVVLLHGLTDSPYSQRHIARFYRDRGFVAVVPRLPAHGTVPAALTDVEWDIWVAATRLAVREARRLAGPSAPLHLVGFSNGGALALIHALDALGDPKIGRPDRLVLISPMVGITSFARFAGLAALPAYLPAFAKAAWLGVVPEFNPFKYNSFPVNGATQTHQLTRVLQERIARYGREGKLKEMPPVLTFQSVMDFTVSTRAILSALYAHLPANGSELVLFDVNRSVKFGPLLRSSANTAIARILPGGAQSYRTVIITNRDDMHGEVVERAIAAGGTDETTRPLSLRYPDGLYSLSHVAIPFPASDGLYGMTPDPAEDFGLSLGTLAPRGERNVLIASLDALLRASSNPFFPYVLERIGEGIPPAPAKP